MCMGTGFPVGMGIPWDSHGSQPEEEKRVSGRAMLACDAVAYHGDAVIEQRFAEDDDVEQLIDVNRLEDSEHGDWIDSGQ